MGRGTVYCAMVLQPGDDGFLTAGTGITVRDLRPSQTLHLPIDHLAGLQGAVSWESHFLQESRLFRQDNCLARLDKGCRGAASLFGHWQPCLEASRL